MAVRSPLPFAAACLGIAIFTGMDAVMKHLSLAIGSYNAMLWRTLISVPMLLPLFLLRRGRLPARPVLILHVARALSLATSMLFFFWGLARLPMALGVALSFIAPLLALGMAAYFLKEQVARSALGASLLAFGGMLVILAGQPKGAAGAADWLASAAILIAATLYAVGVVIGRSLAQRAGPLEIATILNIVASSYFLIGAPWLGIIPASVHWPFLLGAAVSANISMMLLSWAYARAEAQHLLPVEYTAFLWASLFGWLVFGEVVTAATLTGAALIVIACLWAARGGRRAAS
ncbi:MAG: DMT family transporter [Sphingobium sp.]